MVQVVVLRQLTETGNDKNRDPQLPDFDEFGAIKQNADLMALLYKPGSGMTKMRAASRMRCRSSVDCNREMVPLGTL